MTPIQRRTPRRARQLRRALAAVLFAGLVFGAVASAAPTTLSSPTVVSGNTTLSTTGITATGAGVTATFDLVTALSWTQPASLGTSFDPNLVRQGRTVSASDTYTRPSAGSMSVTWTLNNLEVSWEGVGPLDLGSPNFSASGTLRPACRRPGRDVQSPERPGRASRSGIPGNLARTSISSWAPP